MIQVYADASCHGNPGPAGIGLMVNHNGSVEARISLPVEARTTNAWAELKALIEAIKLIDEKRYMAREVVIYSDSQYALGIATGALQPHRNIELCEELTDLVAGHPGIEFRHIDSRRNPADEYARQASRRAAQRMGLLPEALPGDMRVPEEGKTVLLSLVTARAK